MIKWKCFSTRKPGQTILEAVDATQDVIVQLLNSIEAEGYEPKFMRYWEDTLTANIYARKKVE